MVFLLLIIGEYSIKDIVHHAPIIYRQWNWTLTLLRSKSVAIDADEQNDNEEEMKRK